MRRTVMLALALGLALVSLLHLHPGLIGAQTATPTTETNKAINRRFSEAFAAADLAALDALTAPNYVDRTAAPGEDPSREGLKQLSVAFRTAFPDLTITIEDQVAEGNKVAARLTFHGTQTGEFAGVPPSGKSIAVTGIHILRIEGGKVVDHWGVLNQLGLMQQLGAVSPPGATPAASD